MRKSDLMELLGGDEGGEKRQMFNWSSCIHIFCWEVSGNLKLGELYLTWYKRLRSGHSRRIGGISDDLAENFGWERGKL